MGPMIDAAGLRVMRAIADEGSFTAAALALGYSQPAVSQMVKRLEQRTGTVLVEKVGRSVRLTEAGAVLARHEALARGHDDGRGELAYLAVLVALHGQCRRPVLRAHGLDDGRAVGVRAGVDGIEHRGPRLGHA